MIARVALALALIASPAAAHDFWIELDRSKIEAGETVLTARFKIGEAAKPEDWNTRVERIVALRSYGPDGKVRDQQAEIMPGEPGSATIRLQGEGTHIVTLESTPSESDLSAAEFNDYAKHEGLAAVMAWREANGQSSKNGRELYARRAKALVQLGATPTDTVATPLGMSLEIVPERNPSMLKDGEPLPVRLFYRGKPLEGAMLRAEPLTAVTPSTFQITDKEGRARIALPDGGAWKIATVWSTPITGNPKADFDTLFASLTFHF